MSKELTLAARQLSGLLFVNKPTPAAEEAVEAVASCCWSSEEGKLRLARAIERRDTDSEEWRAASATVRATLERLTSRSGVARRRLLRALCEGPASVAWFDVVKLFANSRTALNRRTTEAMRAAQLMYPRTKRCDWDPEQPVKRREELVFLRVTPRKRKSEGEEEYASRAASQLFVVKRARLEIVLCVLKFRYTLKLARARKVTPKVAVDTLVKLHERFARE